MTDFCSVCQNNVDGERAAILTLGGFGNPRYMCDECAADFDTATTSRDLSAIGVAIDRISKKMTSVNQDDKAVLKTVKEIMEGAVARAEEIKNGTYDFSEEEASEPVSEEIPDELRETEEDKETVRLEEEKNKKIDKISNWVCLGLIVGALGFLVYRIIVFFS